MQENVKKVSKLLKEQFKTKIKVNDNVIKTTVPFVDNIGIRILNHICDMNCKVRLKRSGVSITIIATIKKK